MTIQEAKDQAALEFGYHTFEQASNETNYSQEIRINNTAMEIYAEAKAKEAYNQGVMDAAESAKIICVLPDGVEVNDGDDIVNIPEGELTNLKISVNKHSILKLLK